MRRLATPIKRQRARSLRGKPPASEAALWRLLRGSAISGFRFRRRAIVLGWIPDFWCPFAKLAIEIDDDQSEWKKDRDLRREKQFEEAGIRTLHIPARDIFDRPKQVVAVIAAVLATASNK